MGSPAGGRGRNPHSPSESLSQSEYRLAACSSEGLLSHQTASLKCRRLTHTNTHTHTLTHTPYHTHTESLKCSRLGDSQPCHTHTHKFTPPHTNANTHTSVRAHTHK